MRTAFPIHRSIRICAEHPLDILGEGGYALAAPSVIDHTLCDKAKCDRTGLGEYRIISEARTILQVEDLLASIKSRCARLGWKIREPTDRISEPIEHGLAKYTVRRKPLSKARMNRLVRNVAQAWIQGKRHQLALYLGGYFAKMGIREADAIAIVTRVCELTKDEESTDRILAVRESYTKPPDQVKGYSGLEELMAA